MSFLFLIFSPFYLFIYFIFLAMLSLNWSGVSVVVVSEGLLVIAVSRCLIAVASLIGEHGLLAQELVVAMCGLSCCSFWDLEQGLSSCFAGLHCSTACQIFLNQGLHGVYCIGRWTLPPSHGRIPGVVFSFLL